MRKSTPWSLAALIVTTSFSLPAHTQESASPLPSVVVTTVTERDIAPELSFIGRVEAKEKVYIQARVEGFLEQRLFTEGSIVKKGDLLYILEKAPYEIAVAQSQADLAGAEATLKNARSDLSRKEELRKKKVVSEASLDTSLANESSALASVMQAKASLRKAELNLSYTEIHSPIDGQISSSRYSVGNLVNASSEPLATITSMDPIYVNVPVSDKIILEVRREGPITEPTVTPTLTLSDGKPYEFAGQFDFINTEVNQNTNSITTRAVFPNPNHLLVPGQFVNVAVRAKETHPALVIPQSSVQKDQTGYFVLAVNRDNKVEIRRIDVGEQIETDWVVTNGLLKGERIIVQGIQKVRPDMQVNPVEEGA
ncbi:efflux RND transporter periplasmic adaptor subunit [Kiloniella laminariae]|uniref:Efflux RND transporter periplasmic adaptor subunit n=1 Tax=Kiloniella laminariae TaxID=454162 RepID=A0ABT4LKC7_9PROT|nr:efflux RND transporter periplasmic adaptor subunit [Kiloniella laminariae]MCZ4281559.1 efflux RND transporter periplasmic adaptor subunit [Kiloniella laminariae]